MNNDINKETIIKIDKALNILYNLKKIKFNETKNKNKNNKPNMYIKLKKYRAKTDLELESLFKIVEKIV